jgi:hypothetical protein
MEQTRMLDDEIDELLKTMETMVPGVGQEVTYTTLEKTGDYSYKEVEVTTTVNMDGLNELIQELDYLKMSILALVKNLEDPYNAGPPGNVSTSSDSTVQKTYNESDTDSEKPTQGEIQTPVNQQTLNSDQDSDDTGKLSTGENNDPWN